YNRIPYQLYPKDIPTRLACFLCKCICRRLRQHLNILAGQVLYRLFQWEWCCLWRRIGIVLLLLSIILLLLSITLLLLFVILLLLFVILLLSIDIILLLLSIPIRRWSGIGTLWYFMWVLHGFGVIGVLWLITILGVWILRHSDTPFAATRS